jgi:hypothetical protein
MPGFLRSGWDVRSRVSFLVSTVEEPANQEEGRHEQDDDQQGGEAADAEPDDEIDQVLQAVDKILKRFLGHAFRVPTRDLDRL